WNVHPHWAGDFVEPTKLTQLMTQHNVRAVTIHPKTNGWNALSATSEPLFRELEKQRVLTIVEFPAELPETQLEDLLQKYPVLPVLVRGTRWTWQRTLIPLLIKYKNLHISFDHFQANDGPEFLVSQMGGGCEDQLVFSSNAPMMSAGAHRAYVDYAEIPQATKDKFASGNLIRLLKGLRPPREWINSEEDELMRAVRNGQPVPCLVVDPHCHVLDEGLHGGGNSQVMVNGGPKRIIEKAKRMGVSAIGYMSWQGTFGVHSDDGNETVRKGLDASPSSYWGLASFDPLLDSAEVVSQKIDRLFADKRFLGFKPYYTFGVHYDRPEFDPWWEYANKHHLYAFLHMSMEREDFSEFDVLCPKYPNVTWVAPHCGGSYKIADGAIARAKKFHNFRAEVTLTPVPCGMIDYLVEGCGVEKVLYGSDQPMRDPRQQLGWVVFSRLSLADKKKVLGLNTQRMIDGIRERQT
ncbi:MAG: amidohydrolase family protein, partial [Phycisphaerales bacterium]|nr:amidohydrolase family protein [Phycisphaerales bacterium]